jgi:glutamate carboxypeptidase
MREDEMDIQALLAYFSEQEPAILATIKELVVRETPSDDKPRLDAFAEYYAERLRAAGAMVDIVPCAERGNHVRARLGHDAFPPEVKPALILCHYDTVWPVGSLETHPFRVVEGKAYGPGIFDMQSSLAMSEYVLRAVGDLKLELPRPITLLATSDEEVGSYASRALIEDEGRLSEYALVLESPLPGGVLKTARKGGGIFEITTTGRAAHAGVEPEKGISAVTEMAHQILYIQGLADPEYGTTVSVGLVRGGSAHNVIPASAWAQVDVRSWRTSEVERVTTALRGLEAVTPGARVDVSGGPNRPPLERTATAELFTRVQEIGKKLGLDLEEGSTGGGSDASWTGALGIPTLDGMGVPGLGAHADHEHIEVDQIASRTALLAACLLAL